MKTIYKLFMNVAFIVSLTCIVNMANAQCTVNAGSDVTIYRGYPPFNCVTLTATSTGTPPFTYLWSNGDTSQSITVCDTANAVYTVTVTDATACTASDNVAVTVVDVRCGPHNTKVLVCHVPPGNPADAHVICINSNAVAAHLAHGDNLGPCAPPPPTCSVNLGNDTSFCSSQGNLILDAGAGYVTYLWSDSSSAQTLTVSSSGMYWVQVTDSNACMASDSINVTIFQSPTANAGNDTTVVQPDCASLFGSASGGTPPYSFLWNTGDTTQALLACDTVSATYIFTVTDSNGCSSTDSVTVTVLPAPPPCSVNIGPDTAFCSNLGNLLLDAGSGYVNYLWSDSSSAQTLLITASGLYWVQVTDSNNCVAIDSINVTIYPSPTASAGNDTTVTEPACATLYGSATGGTPPYSFLWSNNDTAQVAVVCDTVTTTYILTVVDANGCSSTDSVTVTVIPTCSIDLGADTSFCSGEGSYILDAGSGYVSYLWSDSSAAQSIGVTVTGTYWVQVMDADSCVATDSISIVVYPSPSASAGNDTTVTQPDCASLFGSATGGTPPYSYLWNTGDTTQAILSCDSISATYILMVTDSNGCTATDSVVVTVIPQEQININPNPNSDGARMSFIPSFSGPSSLELYDMEGKLIELLFSSYVNEGMPYRVDFSPGDLPPGIYIVRLITANGNMTNRKMVLIK